MKIDWPGWLLWILFAVLLIYEFRYHHIWAKWAAFGVAGLNLAYNGYAAKKGLG